MRVNRGALTARRIAVGACVLASGGLMTAAMAAGGPILYSEYTNGGDREGRLVQQDGTGDIALPKDVIAAATSPDGTRIAQVGLTEAKADGVPVQTSWLRVTAGDGSAPRTIAEERSEDGRMLRRAVTSTPVWSPDGSRVMVARTTIDGSDGLGPSERLLCVVDTGVCRGVGRMPTPALGESAFGTDLVGWQRRDGPLRATSTATGRPPGDALRPCGARGGRVPQPQLVVSPVWNAAGFGGPLRLRGLATVDDDAVDPRSAGALAVGDGTLVHELPAARVLRGRVRCGHTYATVTDAVRAGLPRLALRREGRTAILPTPPGLRAGDGLELAALSDGGALVITRGLDTGGREQLCEVERRKRVVRWCNHGYSSAPDDGSGTPRETRVWRYRPGAAALAPVTGLRRSALRTLRFADDLTVATGDAVLAVSERAIERVPLDGGAPTTVARGAGISLDLQAWE